MHAIIFDIDGTLLKSNEVDGALYLKAVRSVLGEVRLRASWNKYDHVTDTGILQDICADNELTLDADALARIRSCFFDLLGRHIENVGAFAEIPGARAFVSALRDSAQHAVAYATGGWGPSARLKLRSAGFPLNIPLSSSDDHLGRISIMRHALEALGGQFSSITYYGDALWDEAATRALGWEFVAVGSELNGLESYPK
jgi:FMN phosphatase YigB (HAD superfamily)